MDIGRAWCGAAGAIGPVTGDGGAISDIETLKHSISLARDTTVSTVRCRYGALALPDSGFTPSNIRQWMDGRNHSHKRAFPIFTFAMK